MRRTLISWGRQLVESFALIGAFITFSGVIQRDKSSDSVEVVANDSYKHSLLGMICTTSILGSLEQYEAKIYSESRSGRAIRVLEPALKAVVVIYAINLDTLMKKVREAHHPYLLYPAFGAFFLILGRRAVKAAENRDFFSAVMLTIASVSNLVAAIGIAVDDENISMSSLLVGGAACAGLFAKQLKDFIQTVRTGPSDLEIPLTTLETPRNLILS